MDTRTLHLSSLEGEASDRETAMSEMQRRNVVGEIRRRHSAALPMWFASVHSASNRWGDHLHRSSETSRRSSSAARDENLPLLCQHWQAAPACDHDRRRSSGHAVEQQRNRRATDRAPGTGSDPTSQRTPRYGRRLRVETDSCGHLLLHAASLISSYVDSGPLATTITLNGEIYGA